MRKYRTTIIALAVLAVVVVGFVLVLKFKGLDVNFGENGIGFQNNTSPTADPNTGSTSVKLFSFNTDDIVGFESSFNDKFNLSIVTEKDESDETVVYWVCDSDKTIEVHDDSVDTVVGSVVSLSGEPIKDVDEENYKDYGFANGKSDVYFTFLLKDDKKQTLYIGDPDQSGSYYYVRVEGVENTIYKVSSYYVRDAMVEKQDLINLKIFTFGTDDKYMMFSVTAKGSETFNAVYESTLEDGSVKWQVEVPAKRSARDTELNQRITAMRNLTLTGIAEENCESLSEFGLDVPIIEYYLESEDSSGARNSYLVKIGGKTSDGENYYCLIDDSHTVYTISVNYIYPEFNPIGFLDSSIFAEDWTTLSKVDVTVSGEHHSLGFEHSEEDSAQSKVFFDGRHAPNDDTYEIVVSDNSFRVPTAADKDSFDIISDNPEECARQVLFSLYVLSYSAFDANEPTDAGDVVLTAKYTRTDGSVCKVELLKRDNTTAYVYINDVYAGGYCKTTSIKSEDYEAGGLAAAIKASLTIMKMVP